MFHAPEGACYRCLYPEPPPPGLVPSCSEGGILGVLPGIVGTIQANEVLKLLLDSGESLLNRLLVFDSWKMRFRELKLTKDPNCPVCGKQPTITELVDYEEFCGLKKPEEEVMEEIAATELKQRFDQGEELQIIDVRQPHELAIGKLPQTKAIPFGQLVRRQKDLDPARDVILVCKVGILSKTAARQLRESGYRGRLLNLQDGINSWADQVDPTMAKY